VFESPMTSEEKQSHPSKRRVMVVPTHQVLYRWIYVIRRQDRDEFETITAEEFNIEDAKVRIDIKIAERIAAIQNLDPEARPVLIPQLLRAERVKQKP